MALITRKRLNMKKAVPSIHRTNGTGTIMPEPMLKMQGK